MSSVVKTLHSYKSLVREEREVTSPFNGEVIGSVQISDDEDLEKALEDAHSGYSNREKWLPKYKRVEILEATAHKVQKEIEEFSLLIAQEGGKPLNDAKVEVNRAIEGLKYCAALIKTETTPSMPMGINHASKDKVAFSIQEPIGVVVAVSAFNHPLNLIVHQVGPAVAAGCPFIVKPASATPLSCLKLVHLMQSVGLPKELGQVIVTKNATAASKLATDPRVAFLSFIGSAEVGWSLRSKLAPGTRCALEHGGVAPIIITEDADEDLAIEKILKGGFYHAGQVCVSSQRIYVHHSISDEFARRLASHASKLVVGDPTSPETEVGPLISKAEVQRIDAWVSEAKAKGGEILTGGHVGVHGTCYEPTVVFDPPANCNLSKKEAFGPVVCIYPYWNLDDALDSANSLSMAFQAAVFTSKYDTAMRVFKNIDASSVMLNDHTAFRTDWMPFAGLKQSGLGIGGIPNTFREITIEKTFIGTI